jgi:hypothetical protein
MKKKIAVFLTLSLINFQASLLKAETPVPHPGFKMQITEMCMQGFVEKDGFMEGGTAEGEEFCDKANLRSFARLMGLKPEGELPGEAYEKPEQTKFDEDGDGKISCDDFYAWKKRLRSQYEKEYRVTSGAELKLEECPAYIEPPEGTPIVRKTIRERIEEITGPLNLPLPTKATFQKFGKGSSMIEIYRTVGYPSRKSGREFSLLFFDLKEGGSCFVGTYDLRGTATYVQCPQTESMKSPD